MNAKWCCKWSQERQILLNCVSPTIFSSSTFSLGIQQDLLKYITAIAILVQILRLPKLLLVLLASSTKTTVVTTAVLVTTTVHTADSATVNECYSYSYDNMTIVTAALCLLLLLPVQ